MPQDRLPAKPSFYRYVLVLCALNVVAALGAPQPARLPGPALLRAEPQDLMPCGAGALMLGARVELGYCVYGVAHWAYFALLPLVRHQCGVLLRLLAVPAATLTLAARS